MSDGGGLSREVSIFVLWVCVIDDKRERCVIYCFRVGVNIWGSNMSIMMQKHVASVHVFAISCLYMQVSKGTSGDTDILYQYI